MSGEKYTVAWQLQPSTLFFKRPQNMKYLGQLKSSIVAFKRFILFKIFFLNYWKVVPGNIALLIIIPKEVVERRNIFQSYIRRKTGNISYKTPTLL